MEVYAKGKRGIIYKQGSVCVKEKNPRSRVDTLRNEAEHLRRLNKKGIGPRFIKYKNKKLYREFVEGVTIKDFLEKEESKKKIISVLKQVLEQCRTMDLMGVNKNELTNPYKDILVTRDNKAVMIDFERCKKAEKPKNVTQFLQYIAKNKELLRRRGVLVDKDELVRLGRLYKNDCSEENFKRIIRMIENQDRTKPNP